MPGRSTTFSTRRTAIEFLSASSPKAIGRVFAANSACRSFWTIQRCAPPPTGSWRARIIPRAAEIIKGWNIAKLSEKLDALNICFSPINRPEDLFNDPHVLRPGGLVNNFNADGTPFRVPALPIEWNGANIGEGLKVAPLGDDTAAVRAELEQETGKGMRKRA